MSSIQVVEEKVAEIERLTSDFVAQAAASLVSCAARKNEEVSLDEMNRRLDGALKVLRGQEVPRAATPSELKAIALQVAKAMISSYAYCEKTRVSTFMIPTGVSEVEAMRALNEYSRTMQPQLNRDVIYSTDLYWYEKLPKDFPSYCKERDLSHSRAVTITAVVAETIDKNRRRQGCALMKEGLVFSDPRDQALAAALHALRHNREDLFENRWMRGVIPGFELCAQGLLGVYVGRLFVGGDGHSRNVAASGSPIAKSTQPYLPFDG